MDSHRNIHAEGFVGRRFGKLTVIEYAYTGKYHQTLWRCKCDCGNETTVYRASLVNGNTKSCGCLQRERQLHANKYCNVGRQMNATIAKIVRDDFRWKDVCEAAGLTIDERRLIDRVRDTILNAARESAKMEI